MLRIYFLQQWFNLSDPAVEEALYDSAVMRCFVGIDLGNEPVPDETRCASSATCWKNTG
jgi:IS5 family transposase